MGNLHAGHQSLIKLARARTERVVASVFVNPTQFGPNEDFERYPRTLVQDQAALAEQDCDLLFAPEVATIYPFGAEHSVSVRVPRITDTLEGAHRPGHFDGMATVVCKLFNLVQPDVAVFGQKDFQQLKVIERMVRDLALAGEGGGGADPARRRWPGAEFAQPVPERRGARARAADPRHLAEDARAAGQGPSVAGASSRPPRRGWCGRVSCPITWRSAAPRTWPSRPRASASGLIALVAARLGNTRLIDNLLFD